MSSHVEHGQVRANWNAFHGPVNSTLVIGDIARWKAEGRLGIPVDGFKFVGISELNVDILNEHEPDIILSPLMIGGFDAIDVALKLSELRYQGRYRAISDDLPDGDLIRDEVRNSAPSLDFDLLLMAGC